MKLRRCCRTCEHLCPQLVSNGWYDYNEKFIGDYNSSNCQFNSDDDIDEPNNCEYYKPIKLKYLFNKGVVMGIEIVAFAVKKDTVLTNNLVSRYKYHNCFGEHVIFDLGKYMAEKLLPYVKDKIMFEDGEYVYKLDIDILSRVEVNEYYKWTIKECVNILNTNEYDVYITLY